MSSIRSITILIATYNRWPQLRRALLGLNDLAIPEDMFVSVRVVDNGSSPPMGPLFASFLEEHQIKVPVEMISEPRKGKSHALNTGLRELNSDLIAFTDDDRELDPDWLVAATQHMQDCGCCGINGKTLVKGVGGLPPWFSWRCGELLGATPQGLPEGAPLKALDGGNMLVRGEVARRNGPFRTDLGPTGKKVGYSEDIEWSSRLCQFGKLCHCPGAMNHHIIEPERLSFSYLIRRQFDYIVTEAFLDSELGPKERRWQNSSLPREAKSFLGALILPKMSVKSIDYWLEMSHRVGLMWGLARRIARGT